MTRRLACCGLIALAAVLGSGARRLGAGEPVPPAPAEWVRVNVRDVRPVPLARASMVVLETVRKDRLLSIVVGNAEGIAILRGLRPDERPPRPMTHDLLKRVITELGATLTKVVVPRLERGTFYAELVVQFGHTHTRIDARPSDGVALALRFGAPVFVARRVLDEAGVPPGQLPELPPPPMPPRRPPIDDDDDII